MFNRLHTVKRVKVWIQWRHWFRQALIGDIATLQVSIVPDLAQTVGIIGIDSVTAWLSALGIDQRQCHRDGLCQKDQDNHLRHYEFGVINVVNPLTHLPFRILTKRGLHENFSSQSLKRTNFRLRKTNKLPSAPPTTPRKIFSHWSYKFLQFSSVVSDKLSRIKLHEQ